MFQSLTSATVINLSGDASVSAFLPFFDGDPTGERDNDDDDDNNNNETAVRGTDTASDSNDWQAKEISNRASSWW